MPRIFFNDTDLAGYRIHFYSSDCRERMHVHVERDENTAKFWLDVAGEGEQYVTTVQLFSGNHGYSNTTITTIKKALERHGSHIEAVWDKHCKQSGSTSSA
jgi:hypothetical protein